MKRKIGALFTAAAMAGGLGLATAGPALAGSGDSQIIRHDQSSIGGSVGVKRADSSSSVGIGYTNQVSWVANNGEAQNKHWKFVQAGSGYCVWERTYVNTNGNPRGTKVVDRTYGKINGVGQPTQWWTLGSSEYVTGSAGPQDLLTDLAIFKC